MLKTRRPRSTSVRLAVVTCLLAGGLVAFLLAKPARRSPADVAAQSALPKISSAGGYLQSSACRECHPQQHASWHRSFHRTMTQLATPKSVVAPFSGTRLEFEGMVYRLEQEDDRYFVSCAIPAGSGDATADNQPIDRREMVLTTGSHHIQVYWISDPASRRLVELPFYYHIADRRWILRDDTMLRPPGEPHVPSVWNDRCIKCHSVAGVPGLDTVTGMLSSRVAELGIACEACHGPGERHVAFHRAAQSGTHPREAASADATIINPRNLKPHAATQICARCHSASQPIDLEGYLVSGLAYRPGDELHDFMELNQFDPSGTRRNHAAAGAGSVGGANAVFDDRYEVDGYWKDGTCRVGGDEYNALVESACFKQGELSCLSCHSLHQGEPSDQLSAAAHTNEACTQCHDGPQYNTQLETHTHHAAGSQGSLCYNCHMPHTSYALLTAMRSHRVDSPSVASSVRTGRPNACNLCHLDRTLKWSAEHLTARYGAPAVELTRDEQEIAASLLWLLKGDAALRAIAAWHLGWSPALLASGDDWQAPFLAIGLNDSYSAVRYVSEKSVRRLPGFHELTFDFVGLPRHRAEAAAAVHARWEANSPAREPFTAKRLLLHPGGKLDVANIERLLQQRDHRPVSIAE